MKTKKRSKVRLGIVGTGGMANYHASQFSQIPGVVLAAGCDVDVEKAREFCGRHKIAGVYGSIEKMLDEASIDAVAVVTPDAFHKPVTLKCLARGKHVLCEKPLALNYRDAKRMQSAAEKAGVVNMVNFSYRDWSCLEGAKVAVARGEIGEVRHVEASYLQAWLASKCWGDWRTNPAWLWRLSSKHGSKGVLGDVGVHILDFVTYPVGPVRDIHCRLKAFSKAPGNRVGEYVLDANDSAVMNMEFAGGALGVVHTSRWVGGHANRLFLKIAGTHGTIEIDSDKSTTAYRVCRGENLDANQWIDVECKPIPTNYQKFITAIRTGKPAQPDFSRGAEIQKILDACFQADELKKPVKV